MTRKEELEKKLDSLLEKFKDIDYEEVVETLEYYASIYQSKKTENNMITLNDIKNANNICSVFKRHSYNKGMVLDASLFDTLYDFDINCHRKYDFDVYLPKFGINLQRPYVWEYYQQQELILSLLFEKQVEKVVAILHNSDLKRKNAVTYIIDGKQRLLTIQKFIHNEFPINLNGKQVYFKDFDKDVYYFFRSRVNYIVADVYYSYDNEPISDEEKIIIFNFYNFSGTPQTEEHKNKLEALLQNTRITNN